MHSCNNVCFDAHPDKNYLVLQQDAGSAPQRMAKPSPGQFFLFGHAFLYGAASATSKFITEGSVENFSDNFKEASCEAATAVSPLNGFILREHLLKEEASS
jgi:hypothetical protein